MYLLGYRLSHYAVSPTDGGDDRPTGLRSHVRDVYNELAPAEPGGDDLPLQVGLLVALLTAADENTYREYVYALAENESDYHQIVAILDDQQGRIIYGVDAATQTYRVNHPLWGMLFLEEALERNEELTITRFESAVNAVFRLFDDTAHRERVSSWTSQETPLLQESESSISETADTFALSVFQVGVERPTLAALVGTSDNSGLELPDACTVEIELYCINRRGRMFKKRGGPGEGTMEAGGVSDPYGDFSKTGDRGSSAKRSGRSDLERAATEYRRRLEFAEQAEEVSSEELREHEAGSLLNLGGVAQQRGNLETAEDRLRRARSQFDSIGDDHSATICLANLGVVAGNRGNYETAEDRLRRAGSQFDSIGDDHSATKCLLNLGTVARKRDNLETAEDRYGRARSLFDSIGDDNGVASCTANLGKIAQRRGDLRQACERFETALEMFLQLNLRHVPSHRSLEEVYEALVGDDPERVEEGLERLLAIAEQTESPDFTRRLRQTRHEMGLDGS
jgi:tetratricopeptide (TPR) repeat protein